MSTVSSLDRGGALSSFLAQTSGNSTAANGATRRFEAVLQGALESAGLKQDQLQITRDPAQSGGAERFVLTILPDRAGKHTAALPESAPAGLEQSTASFPDYDPSRGPRITKSMWTEEMLTGELTSKLLNNIQNPGEFLRARVAQVRKPTDATMVGEGDGNTSGLNSSFLSTRQQAETMRQRLLDLGINVNEVQEQTLGGGPYQMNWGAEDRRVYTINGLSVGLLIEKYARHTSEVADQLIRDQLAV